MSDEKKKLPTVSTNVSQETYDRIAALCRPVERSLSWWFRHAIMEKLARESKD